MNKKRFNCALFIKIIYRITAVFFSVVSFMATIAIIDLITGCFDKNRFKCKVCGDICRNYALYLAHTIKYHPNESEKDMKNGFEIIRD